MTKNIIIVFTLLSIVGCSTWNRGTSYFHYKDNLKVLPIDKRILVEGTDIVNVQKIYDKLDSSINIVKDFYQTPFSKEIYVTICSTEKSYIKRSGGYKNSEAMTNWNRVFLAPLTFQKNNEIPVLIHELTHLHICQKIGIIRMICNIPPWFNEGLAVVVSGGAGAEEYTDSAAIDWINNNKCIDPKAKGNFLKPSNDSKLPWDMFYRQSSLFVSYLQEEYPNEFKVFLSDIENKKKFKKAFEKCFNKSIIDAFQAFKDNLKFKEKVKKSS